MHWLSHFKALNSSVLLLFCISVSQVRITFSAAIVLLFSTASQSRAATFLPSSTRGWGSTPILINENCEFTGSLIWITSLPDDKRRIIIKEDKKYRVFFTRLDLV